MSAANELRRTMESFGGDVGWELQKRGYTDHDGLRDFANAYGEVLAEVHAREDRESKREGYAASLVAGFLLGLDYCQKRQNGGP